MTGGLYVDEEHGKPWSDDEFLNDVDHAMRLREDELAVAAFRKRYLAALAEEQRKAIRLEFKYSEDQPRDERGRFGSGGDIGVDSETAAGLAAAAAGGGFSEQPFTGTEPTNGFMVAGISEPVVVHVGNTEEAAGAIMGFVDSHAADFERDPNLYIGGWLDSDGMLVVELAENVSDRAEAAARGEERNQVAIYDVAGGQEIPTGGTGEYRGSETDRPNLRAASVQLGGDDRRAEAGVVPGAGEAPEGRIRGEGVSPALLAFWDPDAPLKYSEDQPREANGQFGSGGGTAAEEPLATHEQLIPGSDPFPGMSSGEVGNARLEEAFRAQQSVAAKVANVERISANLIARMETDRGLAHNLQELGRSDLVGRGASHYEHLGITQELAHEAVREAKERDLNEAASLGRVVGEYPALEEMGARALAANMQDSWAGTASDSSLTSLAMQEAVGERFGAGDTSWMRDLMARDATTGPYSVEQQAQQNLGVTPEGARTFGDQVSYAAQSPAVSAYVEEVYRSTQSELARLGITEVTLYRGVSAGGARGLTPNETVTLNPLSSFSTSRATAENFATSSGTVISVTVPAEHIFSTSLTGPGCLGETEAIVIGHPVTLESVETQSYHRAIDEYGNTVALDDAGNVIGYVDPYEAAVQGPPGGKA